MAQQAKYNFGLMDTPTPTDGGTGHAGPARHRRPGNHGDPPNSPDLIGATIWDKPTVSRINMGSSSGPFSTSSSGGGAAAMPGPSDRGLVTPNNDSLFKTPLPRHRQQSSRSRYQTPASRATPMTLTTTTSATPRANSSSVIAALVEGRGMAKGEIGMSSIDLRSPELVLSQFSDSQSYVKLVTRLQILDPVEIIMPNTACENGNMTKLFKMVSEECPSVGITTVQRKYFNETKGLDYIRQLCVREYSTVEMEVNSKYYCLATTAALLKYVEFIQNTVYASHSLKIVFKGSERTAMVDTVTARNLELVVNLSDPTSEHTLYGILNHTRTRGGGRLLRSNILQPPKHLETIQTRLDCVNELAENEQLFHNVRSILARFLDIDHLLSLCVQIPKQENVKAAESKIANVIYLKHTLELVRPLHNVLEQSDSALLKAYCAALNDPRFDEILATISEVVHDDTKYQKGSLNMRIQKVFAIKSNVNGLLDIARRTYSEVVDDVNELVKQVGTRYNVPLKATYNNTRGFYITINVTGRDDITAKSLPSEFLKIVKTKNTLSCTTQELIKLNSRVEQSLSEIYLMSNVIVSKLLEEIRDNVGCLYKLTECVSMLDMLYSFAHVCTLSEYTRPEFTDTLAIRQGFHPILDRIAAEAPTRNNTYATEDSNFIIITGPNMSGKSTYLKQVALCQILAQIGCFVPGQYASFRLTDQIFTRIGSDDDIETNSSTFMLEMKEVNYILQNMNDTSLIVVDELGRGTSSEEGVGMCFAICERLLASKAFTLFATHFLELVHLEYLYPNVENFHFQVQSVADVARTSRDESRTKLVFTHFLTKGHTKEKHYGLHFAELSSLPRSLVADSLAISAAIVSEGRGSARQQTMENRQQRLVFKLASRLIQAAKNSRLDSNSLKSYVKNLKAKFVADDRELEE